MKKTLSGAMDIAVLVCMLVISALITVTSVNLIVGDVANVKDDKALVDVNALYENLEIRYSCADLLAAVTCFDFMYPVSELHVFTGSKETVFYPTTTLTQVSRLKYSKDIKDAIKRAYDEVETDNWKDFNVNDMMALNANLEYRYNNDNYVCYVTFSNNYGEVLKWETS